MMTAEQAAQKLVQLDPDGPLALHAEFDEVPQTAEIVGIDEDLRLRAPDAACLEPFKAGMQAFLAKPRSVLEVQKAAEKAHIWRRNFAVDASFAATLKAAFPWRKTGRTRLLMCLRLWGMWVAGEQVALQKPAPPVRNAALCVRSFGTPVKLLQAYHSSLGNRLIFMNGSRCTHVWQPDDWATRSADAKVTVALNVWADHVSAYHPDVGCHAPKEPDKQQ